MFFNINMNWNYVNSEPKTAVLPDHMYDLSLYKTRVESKLIYWSYLNLSNYLLTNI